ncbi:SUMF1/EgtB/PvdO family nonheme iron enzyme [Nocardia sp. NPDC047648]|uniref:formylglycine-generating enzyme family protein n=1 Tax=Nocardia sp. NPDC047648 TaxID=3155625 RepID=UPI00340676FD
MINMVWIPGGATVIGSPEHHLASLSGEQHYDRAWFEDEAPQRVVQVPGFWLDRTPVTNLEFAEFVDATGWMTYAEQAGGLVYGPDYWRQMPGICWRHPHPDIDAVADRPNHPVVHVDHDDASAYARWAKKRLPTEIEWEYAAHGPHWRAWPWGSTWRPEMANTAELWAGTELRNLADWKSWYEVYWRENGPAPGTVPVGALFESASPFGVLDMAGQVTEWTSSLYGPYGGAALDAGFAAAAGLGFRSARGGSWKMMRWQTRTSERICGVPDYSAFDLGFRCAADRPAPQSITSDNHEERPHG